MHKPTRYRILIIFYSYFDVDDISQLHICVDVDHLLDERNMPGPVTVPATYFYIITIYFCQPLYLFLYLINQFINEFVLPGCVQVFRTDQVFRKLLLQKYSLFVIFVR